MINLEEARALLKAAVDTQGRDFVYSPGGNAFCQYLPADEDAIDFPTRKTGCLVGVALKLSGIPEDHNLFRFHGSIEELRSQYPETLDRDAGRYFKAAQRMQDGGSTWGKAYDEAEFRLKHNSL